VFDHACDLVGPDGDVVALVLPEIGNGPLNVLVDGWPGAFAAVDLGTHAWTEGGALYLGNLIIKLDLATVWEPRPDWERLRRNREQIKSHLPLMRDLAQRPAPTDSLLAGRASNLPHHAAAWEAAEGLRHAWSRGWSMDQRAEALVARLAGLGTGLTPAGDDFLTGVMLRAWLAHPSPLAFCRALCEAATPRTTKLSAAFLRAAARGECGIAWHNLFDALYSGTTRGLHTAVQEIVAVGHTSGADMLAGFLWLQ
jgi:hypothetical protein